jgi:predicted DCC family thiol-disulfide oxidoreductase YuxK
VTGQSSLLLYDGTCGFCARSVQFVLRFERRHTLQFATLQGGVGAEIRTRHPELERADSVVWVERDASGGERVFVRYGAVLRVLAYVGGSWSVLANVGAIVPRVIGDRMYDFVARHRHQLTRDGPACLVPSPAQRARFVD